MAYEIHISGFIGDPGFFGGDHYNLTKLKSDLSAMPAGTTEIDAIINSSGGWVTEGFALHDELSLLPQIVNTKIIGTGGSIATVVALAPKTQGKGGKTRMSANAEHFIHNPAWRPQSDDPLEADELFKLATDLKDNEERLIDFYVKTIGADKDAIRGLMKASTTSTPEQAKQLGFIDEIITTNISATQLYKIAAHVSKTPSPMNAIEAKIKSMFEGFKNEIKDILKPTITSVKATSDDGKTIYYEGSLAKGTKCFADEAMSAPAPDGTYTINSNKYTVANGEITAVEAVTAKTDLEIANEKIAELTGKLTAKENEVTQKVTQAVTAKETELTASFNQKFTAFQSKFFTGDKLNPEFEQIIKGDNAPAPKPTWQDGVIELRKKQEEAKAKK